LKIFQLFRRDFSLSALVAGFVAVLIGYTSTGAIVFAAAKALGATPAQVTSWMWALGWAMGLACIIPSLRYRLPVLAAWSTPGAALIASTNGTISMPEAIAAFLICGVLIFLSGVTGWFERVMNRIPLALAAALLAGILVKFGFAAFASLSSAPWLVLAMIAAHLFGRRWLPRYAVALVLLVGGLVVLMMGGFDGRALRFEFATPVFTAPQFTVNALFNLAIPLFLVTMLSQNLPGIAVMRAANNAAPISPAIATTGVLTVLLAPFGAFAVNLAAITAAIVMSPEAHSDPKRRYVASVFAGVFYCSLGTFGAIIAGLFAAFPAAFIAALAGLALISTLANSLASALADEREREAAIITFLVAASGVTLLGIGSAFWAVVFGVIARAVLRPRG
jgi:benzoate membrane transport protein